MSETNRGSKIVTGVLWRFGEKVTAQMVSFMVSIVLARLLLPNDWERHLFKKRMQMKLTSQPCFGAI